MPWVLIALLLAQDPPPPVRTGPERHSAVRLQLSGHVDPHFMYRDGRLNEAGGALNGLLLETGSTNAWTGRIGLRADIEVKDMVSGVIELENRSFDEGLNRPFSSDPELDEIDLKQGYIEAGAYLSSRLNLRVGIQDVAFRNRPHDEPFFMGLGEVEGFFDGFAAGQVRNTVDRDVREATGVRLFYTPFEIVSLQALAVVTGEGGGTDDDEAVYAVVANAALPDALSIWLLFAVVSGGDPGLDQVSTLGAGVDAYLGDAKELELFAEAYVQRGKLQESPVDVRKEAFAANLGWRYVGFMWDKLWIETAFSYRSGNRRVSDRRDQAFQSYENENRFLILQSAEFGLDVDTNVTAARIAAGFGPFDVAERPLRFQFDVARFAAVEPLRNGAGALLTTGREDDWGVEADVGVTWSWNESFQVWAKGAWLASSAILEDLTRDRRDEARMFVAGAALKF